MMVGWVSIGCEVWGRLTGGWVFVDGWVGVRCGVVGVGCEV